MKLPSGQEIDFPEHKAAGRVVGPIWSRGDSYVALAVGRHGPGAVRRALHGTQLA